MLLSGVAKGGEGSPFWWGGGGGQMPRGIPSVAVVVGETLAVAMVMVIIPCRRMSGLLRLYL